MLRLAVGRIVFLLQSWHRKQCFSSISETSTVPTNKQSKRTRERQQKQQQQQQHSQEEKQQQQSQQEPCRLTVAVIGLPNAGKSTLTNRLIGTKISGVSSKRNTTINPQLGNFTAGKAQVLLYDTPGLVDQPGEGNPLERLRSAWSTAAMSDTLLLIVDAERQFRLREASLLKLVQQLAAGPPVSLMTSSWQRPPAVLFLNKRDKLDAVVRSTVLQQLRQQLCAQLDFAAVFEGAAMLGEGVDELKQYLVKQSRPGHWLMPGDQRAAASPGELAIELVREKLYRRLNQELPYRLTVTLESVSGLVGGGGAGGNGLHIRVCVGVANKLIKSIVIGKGGEVIQKYVTQPTQAELARILDRPVRLVVSVKIVG